MLAGLRNLTIGDRGQVLGSRGNGLTTILTFEILWLSDTAHGSQVLPSFSENNNRCSELRTGDKSRFETTYLRAGSRSRITLVRAVCIMFQQGEDDRC